VRILSPARNQKAVLRRKDAERLIRQGRAVWVADDQILLNSAPANKSNAEAARAWEDDYVPKWDGYKITQELLKFGTNPPTSDRFRGERRIGLAAIDHRQSRADAPPKKAPAFDDPRRLVIADRLNKHDAEVRAEELALAPQDHALRILERTKLRPSDRLFPGSGRGEAGSCVSSERFRCYRWPERTGWF